MEFDTEDDALGGSVDHKFSNEGRQQRQFESHSLKEQVRRPVELAEEECIAATSFDNVKRDEENGGKGIAMVLDGDLDVDNHTQIGLDREVDQTSLNLEIADNQTQTGLFYRGEEQEGDYSSQQIDASQQSIADLIAQPLEKGDD